MQSILTVCVGNICRSPIAAELLRKELPGISVYSAGTHASPGMPAEPNAVNLMLKRGYDLSSHRAQPVNSEMCLRADLIVVMEHSQKNFIQERYPFSRGRVFRLGQYADQEIFDPYLMDSDAFERCFYLIESNASEWISRVKNLI